MRDRSLSMELGFWLMAGAAGFAAATTGAALAGSGDQTPFTNEAIARGIDYTPAQSQAWGDGVAFADLDGDGDADVIAIGRADGTMGLYENDGTGQFTDRYETCGIGPLPTFSCVVAGDYDRDGDLDLFVTRWEADALLRNDGGFHFTDVSAAAGIDGVGEGAGAAWGDYDGDGWLDLYVANHEEMEVNQLYHNLGDGTFEEIASDLGVDCADQQTFQPAFFDYDQDGDLDLYLANSYGQHCLKAHYRNLLFENDNGTFTDVTDAANAAACVDAMCVGIGDFDNDCRQDIYVTDNNVPGNALLMSQGPDLFGTWHYAEEAEPAGVESFATAWGSVFADYDNDGWLDLYVCNMSQPNRLYRHEGSWPCVDVSVDLGVAETDGVTFAVAAADVDDDGDVDLLVCDRMAPLSLFINHEGEKRGWAKFDVIGEGPNRYAIGASVKVTTGADQRLREVIAGSNYKSQNELILHFGLGAAPAMDAIEVTWLGGVTTRTLTGYPTAATWALYPPDKLGDGDGDGDRDLDDFLRFAECFTGDAPGSIAPGCEMMDHEGDGDVDLTDFDAFLAMYEGEQADCNDNGVIDLIEILDGSAPDINENGVIDECDDVFGDLNEDLFVDGADLTILIGAWGQHDSPADLDGSGTVDFGDLVMLLSNWS